MYRRFLFFIFLVPNFFVDAIGGDLIDDANRLCEKVSQEGFTKQLQLKGSAKAELANILKKIGLSAKVDGLADGKFTEYSGVFQKNLADAIKDGNNCRLKAFKMLDDYSIQIKNLEDNTSRREIENDDPRMQAAKKGIVWNEESFLDAVRLGDLETVELFLSGKFPYLQAKKNSGTVYDWLAHNKTNSDEVLDLLIRYGFDHEKTFNSSFSASLKKQNLLLLAVSEKNTKLINTLKKINFPFNQNVNTFGNIWTGYKVYDHSVLAYSILKGYYDISFLLLKLGVGIENNNYLAYRYSAIKYMTTVAIGSDVDKNKLRLLELTQPPQKDIKLSQESKAAQFVRERVCSHHMNMSKKAMRELKMGIDAKYIFGKAYERNPQYKEMEERYAYESNRYQSFAKRCMNLIVPT